MLKKYDVEYNGEETPITGYYGIPAESEEEALFALSQSNWLYDLRQEQEIDEDLFSVYQQQNPQWDEQNEKDWGYIIQTDSSNELMDYQLLAEYENQLFDEEMKYQMEQMQEEEAEKARADHFRKLRRDNRAGIDPEHYMVVDGFIDL